MEILIDIITAIPFGILVYLLIKGFIKLDKQANEANELCKKEKQLQIENLMLENEIKKEIKKQIEEDKKHQEMDNFLDFLQKKADQLKEKIEKEINESDD